MSLSKGNSPSASTLIKKDHLWAVPLRRGAKTRFRPALWIWYGLLKAKPASTARMLPRRRVKKSFRPERARTGIFGFWPEMIHIRSCCRFLLNGLLLLPGQINCRGYIIRCLKPIFFLLPFVWVNYGKVLLLFLLYLH